MNDAHEIDSEMKFKLGMEEGRRWATNGATPEQLGRLAAAENPVHGWGFDSDRSAFPAGDLLAEILNGYMRRGAFADDFLSIGLEHFNNDSDFVEGFADGCLETWKSNNCIS